jgi:hypothetical protein
MKGQSASLPECRTCTNLRSEHGKTYCDWLESYLERTALSSCYCEGYVCKGSGAKQTSGKSKNGQTCPKTDSTLERERQHIMQALEIKAKFRGSVVWEKIRCGKRSCKCSRGHLHGPYAYLHFYQSGKVKRKYLSKDMGKLVERPKEELEVRLREILGQHQRLKRESSPSELAEVSQP